MPQDGPRSVVYRSFFSCDDPKGVVECKTNRKSKTDSYKLEDKVEHQKKLKNLGVPFSLNEERKDIFSKRPTDELHNPSSYQLMEISRGAHNLNQVIDSWSKDVSLDGQSKDIAKDLLKGALDLKEALAMLGKLQEASEIMTKLKKKQKENAEGAKLDGMSIERTMSDRFGYRTYETLEFQKPRLSVGGSSRDCFEELREVIRESFARQNLLPKSCSEEKAYFDTTKSGFSIDLPSTSSSQSSMFHSHEFDSSSDFSLSKSLEEKPKAPNVIAKLMGLEEVPTKPLQSIPQKHYGKDKGLTQGRTTFDIDLPKARRPHFTVQKMDPQPRSLEELTETIQFKGFMTSKSVDGPEHLSNVSDWKKKFAYDAPPIVIIKPVHASDSLEDELLRKKYVDQDLDTKKMLKKWKMKDGLPPKSNNDQEDALNSSEIHGKVIVGKPPVKRRIQEKGDKDRGNAFAKKYDKSLHQENLSSSTVKASAPVKPKMQKKEVSEKTVPKIQRVAANTRKPIEAEAAKLRDTSKSSHINKLASTNARRHERESNASKVRVSLQKSSTSDSVTSSQSSSVRKKHVKTEKTVGEPSTIMVERKSKNDNLPVESGCCNEEDVTAKCITPSQQLPGDQEKDTSGNLDNCNNSGNSLCESTKPFQPKNENSYMDDAKCGINHHLSEIKSSKSKITRNLLLDSPSFLNHAEELFDACQPMVSHTTGLHDYGTADTKLLLECAKELLEHKSLQCRVAVHPLLHIHMKKSKIFISLDRLVNEICDGIEYLRSYSKLAGKTIVVDALSTVLLRDMWCKGVVNGAWDLGWGNGFTLDEIDRVVLDIEQKILSGIIEDMLMDMVI